MALQTSSMVVVVLVPLILNTVLGFGLYYVVTRDEESCLPCRYYGLS